MTPPRHPDGNNRCHFEEWGGVFICNSESTWNKPDGWPQVFVVAPNKNVYTKWASDDGTSQWLNMSGLCRGDPGVAVNKRFNEWAMTISCQSSVNDLVYHRGRDDAGHWDPSWIRGLGPI